eukprot:GHVT01083448.1.p1 GENE.GHVT01083448.1~~GHVT01083448.1.p1  ORF type:complete len:106 (-),score=9.71 GHVT01083448.1:1047-1364(-)
MADESNFTTPDGYNQQLQSTPGTPFSLGGFAIHVVSFDYALPPAYCSAPPTHPRKNSDTLKGAHFALRWGPTFRWCDLPTAISAFLVGKGYGLQACTPAAQRITG